ncbi:unnamed protein product, partial [marine sediment metagenome]
MVISGVGMGGLGSDQSFMFMVGAIDAVSAPLKGMGRAWDRYGGVIAGVTAKFTKVISPIIDKTLKVMGKAWGTYGTIIKGVGSIFANAIGTVA